MQDTPPSTTKLYWCFVAGGAATSVLAAAVVSVLYYGVMDGGLRAATFPVALRGGVSFGLPTTAFVVLGTVWFAPKLYGRRGWVILMSVVAPIVGWMLFGAVDSGFGPASLFPLYPVIGVVAGVLSGLFVALASFFVTDAAPALNAASLEEPDLAALLRRNGYPADGGGGSTT